MRLFLLVSPVHVKLLVVQQVQLHQGIITRKKLRSANWNDLCFFPKDILTNHRDKDDITIYAAYRTDGDTTGNYAAYKFYDGTSLTSACDWKECSSGEGIYRIITLCILWTFIRKFSLCQIWMIARTTWQQ